MTARSGPARLHTDNDLLTITDTHGTPLLQGCSASVQLSNGQIFPMAALERTTRQEADAITITAGGDAVIPRIELRATYTNGTVHIRCTVHNTTPTPLAIERLDVLVCPDGYRTIPTSELLVRQTGWQMSSPVALRSAFDDQDPWVQPPLYMPLLSATPANQRHLPWMTVLQSDAAPPLLAGFGTATDYLGIVTVQSSSHGHRLTASNYLEGIGLTPGDSITSEPLLIMEGTGEQALLEAYGAEVGSLMHARIPHHTPTGWSHWFAYFAKVSEADIIENARVIQQKDLPLEYVQIDDGYQTHFGDWTTTNERFPGGMRAVADAIRSTGRKPGIWLSPFMASASSDVFAQHPDWFLRDATGRHINVNRYGDPYWPAPNYGLDITHPEAYAWLAQTLTTFCEEWGYDYIKTDFLYAGAIRAVRYDQNCTSVQAYRRGMTLLRGIAGENRLVLGCGAPLLCSVGLVDTMRVGPDLSWEMDLPGAVRPPDVTRPQSRDPLLSLLGHQWMHKNLWVNDADYVRVRQHDISLDWPQTLALTALIALGGGALYDSDRLAQVEPEGFTLLDRLLPVADINARPLVTGPGKPDYICAAVTRGDGHWHVAARFNWADKPVNAHCTPADLQLPAGAYHIYDLLKETYIGLVSTYDAGQLASHNACLYSICAAADHPQVIATKGHLLGPAGDIQAVIWHDNTLHVALAANRRSPTMLYIHIPAGYALAAGNTGITQHGEIAHISPDGDTCNISFTTA